MVVQSAASPDAVVVRVLAPKSLTPGKVGP